MKVKDYAADHIFSFICLIVSGLLVFGLLWLIEIPIVFIFFVEGILFMAFLCAFLYDYWRRRKFYNQLWEILERLEEKTLIGEILVQPVFLDGQILDEILRRCNKYQNDRVADAKQDSQEYREYLDSWVHEIKTPIAAARLIVENNKNPATLRIDDELRRIDGFVEQVLYYARSAAVEKDFKVERTTLQALVNSALKTYSKPLIQAGGRPVFNGLDVPVCADTKSCAFVIGQIISNSMLRIYKSYFRHTQNRMLSGYSFRTMGLAFPLQTYPVFLIKALPGITAESIPNLRESVCTFAKSSAIK